MSDFLVSSSGQESLPAAPLPGEAGAIASPPKSSPRLPRQRWQLAPAHPAEATQLSHSTGLSPLLTQVLINRGLMTVEAAQAFLDPELLRLPQPLEEFPDLAQALDLLLEAIAQQHKIAICGDYDADGMTSTALLLRALRFLGANVQYAIPSRMAEGYGINRRIVEEFHDEGVRLILTVDNGIAAYEPVARARELGLTVIITDHHDLPPVLPPAHAILNPKLIDPDSPYYGVAGVGVAYILAVCLAQSLQQSQDLTAPMLELFTLGTIADLAPLTGVNRRWVRRGLKLLPKSRLAGVQALIEVAGVGHDSKPLKPEAIGFRLGPRINAVGRISDPQLVIELLTTDDEGRAMDLAFDCEEINQHRQRLCELIEQQAIAWCAEQQFDPEQDRVLVVVQPEWHHGVIGIVASRLLERYGVPVFIGTYEDEAAQTQIRGSARGIPEFNVFEALQFCGDILEKFGGHRAAGGFSLKAEHLPQLRSRLQIFAGQQLQIQHLKPLVKADVQASLSQITLDLYQQIDALHPCGIENPDPVFWTPNVRLLEQRQIGKTQAHLKLTLVQDDDLAAADPGAMLPGLGPTHQPSRPIKAIAWRWGEYFPLPDQVDIAYRLRLNEWNGQQTVELELVGMRPAAAATGGELSPPADGADGADKTSIQTPSSQETHIQAQETSIQETAKAETAKAGAAKKQSAQKKATKKSAAATNNTSEVGAIAIPPEPSISAAEAAAPEDIQPNPEPNPEPANQAPDLAAPQPAPQSPRRVDFYYSKRQYSCSISTVGDTKELRIKNPEGQILAVQPQQRQGLLGRRRDDAEAVDISHPHYFNLIRAAIDALELAGTRQLLQAQGHLLAEKDEQIATYSQQLALLGQATSQLSLTQQSQLQQLQAELLVRETAIQTQAAHVAQLQAQISQGGLQINPAQLDRRLKSQLGDAAWSCLDPRSQKDLGAAYTNHQHLRSESFTAQLVDYSEAGLRLGFAVEREVVQPFFRALHDHLRHSSTSNTDMGDSDTWDGTLNGINLGPRQKYSLAMLPPLISPQWRSFQDGVLHQSQPVAEADLYHLVLPQQQVSQGDRHTIGQFLTTWEHPLAAWLSHAAAVAAATIAQISQLRHIAASSDSVLYEWQYERLHQLVVGGDRQPGIFRDIYAPSQSSPQPSG